MKFSALAILLWAAIGFSQTPTPARYDVVISTIAEAPPPNAYPPLLAVPKGEVHLCTYSTDGGLCDGAITTYTDATLTTACPADAQVVQATTTVCMNQTDVQGNFGFWYNSALVKKFGYVIISSRGTYGPFPVYPQGGGGAAAPTNNCGPLTADATSTDCGTDNRVGDTAGSPAQVQTFGYQLMGGNSGTDNVAMGWSAGSGNSGSIGVFIGDGAGAGNTADTLTAIGNSAGDSNTGVDVVAIGDNVGTGNSSRYSNFIGDNTGRNSTGRMDYQDCMGFNACVPTGAGSGYVVGIGAFTSGGASGGDIIGIGNSSGSWHSGHNVIGIGDAAATGKQGGPAQPGDDIIGIGNGANIGTGSNTIAIGKTALHGGNPTTFLNTGAENIAIGTLSLVANSSGTENIAIGDHAGSNGWTGNTPSAANGNANLTGSNNVWIGNNAGPNTTTQLSNTVAIGNTAGVNASNQTVIGSPSTTSLKVYGSGDGCLSSAGGQIVGNGLPCPTSVTPTIQDYYFHFTAGCTIAQTGNTYSCPSSYSGTPFPVSTSDYELQCTPKIALIAATFSFTSTSTTGFGYVWGQYMGNGTSGTATAPVVSCHLHLNTVTR